MQYWQPKPRIDLMTVAEWLAARGVYYRDYDGSGRFLKNGEYIDGDVFGDAPIDATHVAWINRWVNVHPQSHAPLVIPG